MMTSRRFLITGLAAGLVITMWGCTELSDEHRVHPGNWGTEHQAKVRTVNYDFTFCQSCHGDDLEGDAETPGCSGSECHKVGAGQSALDAIYACDNCHGYLGDDPFKDVVGNTSWDILTVGMHTSHYTATHSLTSNVSCASCHVVPDSVWAPGHIDETPYAEIPFGTPTTADSTFTLDWNRQNATCTDTYCHGSFDFNGVTGNDSPWTWTASPSGDLCGTCHGLPPDGHITISEGTNCGPCHSDVVDLDIEDNYFITPDGLSKHIDGVKNVFGN